MHTAHKHLFSLQIFSWKKFFSLTWFWNCFSQFLFLSPFSALYTIFSAQLTAKSWKGSIVINQIILKFRWIHNKHIWQLKKHAFRLIFSHYFNYDINYCIYFELFASYDWSYWSLLWDRIWKDEYRKNRSLKTKSQTVFLLSDPEFKLEFRRS